MLDGELFDKLVSIRDVFRNKIHQFPLQEQIARRMRNNNLPFGGIQVSAIVFEGNKLARRSSACSIRRFFSVTSSTGSS